MKVQTTRFGEIEITPGDLIQFPEGVLGFPDSKAYFIVESKESSIFAWLQSSSEPELCFIVTDPFMFKNDYSVNLNGNEIALLDATTASEINILTIVSANSRNSGQINVNLMAPLVINATTRMGYQLIKEEYNRLLRFNIKPILKMMSGIADKDTEAFSAVNF